MEQRVGDHRFDDAAGENQRLAEPAMLEGAATVVERLLEHGPQRRVVHELEQPWPRPGGGRGGFDFVHARQR